MGRLRPRSPLVCMPPVTEYAVGVDVLQDLDLTRAGEFGLQDVGVLRHKQPRRYRREVRRLGGQSGKSPGRVNPEHF